MTNKQINFKFIFAVFAYLFICLFISHPVLAQQVSLSISPPIIQAVMKPGKSIMIAYTLKNSGDPVVVNSKVVSFEPIGNQGKIKLDQDILGPVRFGLDNANLTLGTPFFMNTGLSQQLLLRIRVPDEAPEGDYYYSLLAISQPPPVSEGIATTRATATIASNILITVTNSGIIDIKPKVTLFDTLSRFSLNLFGTPIKIFDSFDRVPVVLYLQNEGKNLIVPQGTISLRGNFGEQANFDIIPQNILSQSQRLMQATPSANIDYTGADRSPASLVLSGFFIGKYNLSTTVNFGDNSPTVFASASFIAFPFKIVAGIIFIVLITYFLIKKLPEEK